MGGLTARQQKALDALLTQEAAARESRRTLGRWLTQNVAFQRALRDAEQEALKRIHRRLAALAERACDALAHALQGEAQPAQVRAADIVLARLARAGPVIGLYNCGAAEREIRVPPMPCARAALHSGISAAQRAPDGGRQRWVGTVSPT